MKTSMWDKNIENNDNGPKGNRGLTVTFLAKDDASPTSGFWVDFRFTPAPPEPGQFSVLAEIKAVIVRALQLDKMDIENNPTIQ